MLPFDAKKKELIGKEKDNKKKGKPREENSESRSSKQEV